MRSQFPQTYYRFMTLRYMVAQVGGENAAAFLSFCHVCLRMCFLSREARKATSISGATLDVQKQTYRTKHKDLNTS